MELHILGIGARVKHPTMGPGVVFDLDERTVHIFFKEHGEQSLSRHFQGLEEEEQKMQRLMLGRDDGH